jgi:predicted metalloprotease with PDZ domain
MTRHLLLQAGLVDQAEFLDALVRPMKMPPVGAWTEVSRDFGADDKQFMQVAMPFMIKMYGLGPRVILALDLEMRRASKGERGVVDLTRTLIAEYFDKDKGFAEDELPAIVGRVAGADMGEFFERYIDGPEVPDPATLLDVIGWRYVEGEAEPVAQPTEAQQRAARDFFSASGEP